MKVDAKTENATAASAGRLFSCAQHSEPLSEAFISFPLGGTRRMFTGVRFVL